MRISRTALSCLLRVKGYGTYPAGATFGCWSPNPIAVEQPKVSYSHGLLHRVQPKPWRFRARSMWRRIFFSTQSLTKPKHCAGMPDRKVVHPTAQHRVDQLHHPIHRLRLVAAEHVLELPQQRRPLLELRRVVGTPCAPPTADAAEVEPQEAEALAPPRSTIRLFSSLISTCRSANSSRSRFSTAPISQSCRG